MITRIELRDKSFNLLEIMDKEFMNLSFGYSRIGGCDSFSFDLPREFCNERFISGDFNVRIYDRRIRTIDDVVIDDVTLDMMEYSSDANAQAAYVTNATSAETLDQSYSTDLSPFPLRYLAYGDTHAGNTFACGITGTLTSCKFKVAQVGTIAAGKKIWAELYATSAGAPTGSALATSDLIEAASLSATAALITFTFSTPYTVTSGTTYCIVCTGDWDLSNSNYVQLRADDAGAYAGGSAYWQISSSWSNLAAWDLVFEVYVTNVIALQSYSESTIKEEGSYSLKGVATTGALNKTLTRTIGSPIDLTDINTVKLKIRSSRTGSNIKIGLHDSGGTTTESTPNITDANTWQEVEIDVSGVAAANKDAIDSIIITIVNADSANTFYIDELFGEGYTIEGYTEPYYNLIYQGLVEDKNPSVKGQEETIQVSGHGYQVQLDRMYIANKTYTSTEVSEIVKDILDTYVVPYTDITYDNDDIEVTTFTPSSIKFNTTAKNALQTLADIVGLREWGVDKDRKFFFKQRSSTVGMRFAFGNKVTGFTSDDSFKDIINRIIIQGGDVSGTPYTNTYNNLISQTKYGRRDQVISNSSVTEDDVAEQLADAVLNEKSDVVRRAKLELVDYNTLIEETIPIPLVAMISRGVAYGERRYGTFLYAGEISYQVNKITYKINDVGTLTTNIDMGAARPNLSETIGQLKYELENLRSASL